MLLNDRGTYPTLGSWAGQLGWAHENHLLADGRRRPHPQFVAGPLADDGIHEELLDELAVPGLLSVANKRSTHRRQGVAEGGN